jgi:hypothetical protein
MALSLQHVTALKSCNCVPTQVKKACCYLFLSKVYPMAGGSTPMTGASTMRTFQCIWAIVAAFFAHRCAASACAAFRGQTVARVAAARFVPIALRDQSLPPSAAAFTGFGLLRGGCPIPAARARVEQLADGSLVLSLPEPATGVDGYFFNTSGGPPGRDPARWRVDVLADDGDTWALWAVQVWRIDATGTRRLYPEIDAAPTLPLGTRVMVDLRIKWPWVFNWVVPNACLAAGGFIMAAAGACDAEHLVRPAAVAATVAAAGSWAAAAVGFWWDGELRQAAAVFSLLPPSALITAGAVQEARVILFLLLYSLTSFAGYWIRDCWLYPSPWLPSLRAALATPAAISLAFVAAMTLSRRAARNAAQSLVLQDWARYDAAWATVVQDPASRAAAGALANIITNLFHSKAPSSPARRASLPPDPCQAESECRYSRQMQQCKPWSASSTGDLPWLPSPWVSGSFRASPTGSLASVFRQYNRLRIGGILMNLTSMRSDGCAGGINWEMGVGDCGMAGCVDQSAPVDSLDQLYAQVHSVAPQNHIPSTDLY